MHQPHRCKECKQDHLLIFGAVGALRDTFHFALETTIEQRGLLFTDKVAVVRNKRTGEIVAEVKMDTAGLIFVDKIAVASDYKTGKKLSTTRDGSRGLIFPKRTADTFQAGTGTRTHRTEMVSKGILCPARVAETTRTDQTDEGKTVTRTAIRGLFFRREVDETDKANQKGDVVLNQL